MTGILVSKAYAAEFGAGLAEAGRAAGIEVEILHLPDDPGARLPDADCGRIEAAYLSRELRFSAHYASFGDAMRRAAALKWVHFASTGIDQHPFLPALIERKVALTTSAGTNGAPVGETVICALLMLARGFPRWLAAQGRREWSPVRAADAPRDLAGQTIAIIGVGNIGATIARFCRAVGMRVIGVRRSAARPDDPVDEMHPLGALPDILPRCDWVVLACPYTKETHHLLNARTLALLPAGARVVNVARGGCVDEPALIAALGSGRLGGAYLDVTAVEPLPADSPLWDLPNVIVTPHSASASAGNNGRASAVFLDNLGRWARGERLLNERQA